MLQIRTDDPARISTDMLVVPVYEDEAIISDVIVNELIDRALSFPEFTGKSGDELLLYQPEAIHAVRVLFLGLGKKEKADAEAFRSAAGKAVGRAAKNELGDVILCLPDNIKAPLTDRAVAEALLEGAALGSHFFEAYKKESKKQSVKTISLYMDEAKGREFADLPDKVETVCRGTILAREWVSMPPNDKRPDRFARSIVKAADKENLTLVVLDEKDLKKNKMHAMLAVGGGSGSKPRMVIMDYRPEGYDKTVALVGKGVTFDSGGINIKPGSGMESMKQDMAGSASVAATVISAARLGAGHRVIGVLPLVENMPSGNAYRPGDIVKTASGKSVEIGNTDAEGRMILADALTYAEKQYNPDALIDMATLTGACIVALGQKIAGVFSFDDKLAEQIVASGHKTHERCWAMPMPDDYRDMLKSDFADLRNVGKSRWGGAIAAALFLSEFVNKSRWAHIDIAGVAWTTGDSKGATGAPVRMLAQYLLERSRS